MDWMQDLTVKLQTHIRERRGDLLPFLEILAEDAAQRGASDELYVINSLRITLLSKRGDRNQVLALMQQQTALQSSISPEVVLSFGTETTTFLAELLLREGRLEEAQQELQHLLESVPLSHNGCPEVVRLLAALCYARGNFRDAIQFWRFYIHLIELYTLLVSQTLISTRAFQQVNLLYGPGIQYLFEEGEEELREQIADGCVHACRLVLSPVGRSVSISARDIPFLQVVEQWLRSKGLEEAANDVARCIDLYQHTYQVYSQAIQDSGTFTEPSD